jgi:hypothetical protein
MIFRHFYRDWILPDDDAGRFDLRLMLDHLAQLGGDHARRWAKQHASWMSDDELDELLDDVGPGKRWSPIALGKAVNLDNATRLRLNIRTIRPVDRTAAQLERDRKKRKAERQRTRRLKAGATPRSQSVEQQKPWDKEGISRRTWYRKKLALAPLALIRAPYSSSQ